MSLGEKTDFVRKLMAFPALSVMVFLRRDLGYRILNPAWLIGVTLVEIVIASLNRPTSANSLNGLLAFALATFGIGMIQRFKRWREIAKGVRQHSFYIGTSDFDFRWLPASLRRNRRIARTIDPLFCIIAGLIARQYAPALGFWLVFAGVCLAGFEADVHRRELDRKLDLVDGLIGSEFQGDIVEQFDEAPDSRSQQPNSGVASGMADDIHENLRRRKSR